VTGADPIDAVRAFVGRLLADKGDARAFRDDERLVTGGRLDSVDVISLISYLEQSFAVDFAAQEFDPGIFDSVDSLAGFLRVTA
jgi:acyl carrier protein